MSNVNAQIRPRLLVRPEWRFLARAAASINEAECLYLVGERIGSFAAASVLTGRSLPKPVEHAENGKQGECRSKRWPEGTDLRRMAVAQNCRPSDWSDRATCSRRDGFPRPSI
jgi:hypothetical protein